MASQTVRITVPANARLRRWLPALLLLIGIVTAAEAAPVKRILILASDPHSSPGFTLIDVGIRRAVTAAFPNNVQIVDEHLDLVYTPTADVEGPFVDFLKAKYAARQPDIVLAVGAASFRFAMERKDRLFPNADIVFGHVQHSDLIGMPVRNDVAGVVSNWGFDKEVDTALRLLPKTRRVIAILGSGPLERAYEPGFRAALARFNGKVNVEWWVGVPMPEMQRRIAQLPAETVVVYHAVYRDDAGTSFVPVLALEQLARRSSVPVFGAFSHYIGNGIVGDGRFSLELLGTQLGEMVVRILRGENPSNVGIAEARLPALSFDARQLERWHIPLNRLPAGAEVKFQQPTLWQQHRWAVLIIFAVLVVQAVLIGALAAQRVARKRAERAEAESQSLYTSVADSLDERVATISRDGTILSANRAWLDFARAHDEGDRLDIGKNYLQAVKKAVDRGQKDAQRTLDRLKAVLSGRETSRQLEYFSPQDGDRWRYEMRIVSLQSTGGGAVVTVQDITDRWQSEERVRIALESLPFATLLFDAAGTIELVNAEAERLFGYSRAELVGRPFTLIIPEFRSNGEKEWLHHDHLSERQVRAERKDGGEVPVLLSLLTIAMMSRTMIIATMQDLSERRKLDAELQRLREEMAHFGRVATVGEMSAAIAHELNQPLTGIMMNCQAAQRLLQDGSFTNADVVETFSDIVADARRAGEVIQRLRAMLRKKSAEVRPLDLNETVKQVQRLAAHDLAMRGAVLDLELTEDLPLINGDRIHLQQVVLNLILNAADAMTGLPPEARHMVLRTRPGINHTVELELRDSGPGISSKAMPHIFEPFFTTKPNGMGMGLSIVRSIIETHGGRITCANGASGGAVFHVSLPAREREAA